LSCICDFYTAKLLIDKLHQNLQNKWRCWLEIRSIESEICFDWSSRWHWWWCHVWNLCRIFDFLNFSHFTIFGLIVFILWRVETWHCSQPSSSFREWFHPGDSLVFRILFILFWFLFSYSRSVKSSYSSLIDGLLIFLCNMVTGNFGNVARNLHFTLLILFYLSLEFIYLLLLILEILPVTSFFCVILFLKLFLLVN
jgi:hypothetical protein